MVTQCSTPDERRETAAVVKASYIRGTTMTITLTSTSNWQLSYYLPSYPLE